MSCCCGPTCAIPSCPQPCCSSSCCQPCCSSSCGCQPCCSPCSYPVGGIGSLSCCPSSCCCSSCCGNSTCARSLGYTSGANVSCVNQLPPSELCIQPPPVVCVIPGPVLAATCEPVRVGGYTSCGGCPPCGRICGSPC